MKMKIGEGGKRGGVVRRANREGKKREKRGGMGGLLKGGVERDAAPLSRGTII